MDTPELIRALRQEADYLLSRRDAANNYRVIALIRNAADELAIAWIDRFLAASAIGIQFTEPSKEQKSGMLREYEKIMSKGYKHENS